MNLPIIKNSNIPTQWHANKSQNIRASIIQHTIEIQLKTVAVQTASLVPNCLIAVSLSLSLSGCLHLFRLNEFVMKRNQLQLKGNKTKISSNKKNFLKYLQLQAHTTHHSPKIKLPLCNLIARSLSGRTKHNWKTK